MRRQVVGDHARHGGGGHRAAAAPEESVRHGGARAVVEVDVGARVAQAGDVHARRQQVGVARAVAHAGEVGDGVVAGIQRALRVRGTDGQHVRVVRGITDPTRRRSVVANRGHNHNAGAPRRLGGEG